MIANEKDYLAQATKSVNAAGLAQVVDPPLTVKITDMLDEIEKRLGAAELELNSISRRLFGDDHSYGVPTSEERPADFSGLVAERLHQLNGLAGNIYGAASRLSNRL